MIPPLTRSLVRQALLYYTFAAIQGLPEAEMTLGFRYWMGIGVKEDCMRALDWYESVAHKGEFYIGAEKIRTRQVIWFGLADDRLPCSWSWSGSLCELYLGPAWR